jgi:hypothetical protein
MDKKSTKCRICGKGPFTNLGVHLNKAHKMTFEEYSKLNTTDLANEDLGELAEGGIVKEEGLGELKENEEDTKIEIDEIPKEEFDAKFDEELGEIDESTLPEEVTTTVDQIRDGVFGEEKVGSDKPLQELLDEFDITEKDLRMVIRQYKTGSSLPVSQQIRVQQDRGLDGAVDLKDKKKVETVDLNIAEVLTTKYGFTCTAVRSRKGNRPKTWMLEKK